MPDTVTVTTRASLVSRLGKALVGLVVGLLLFLAAFPLLWWNEGRAVHRSRSLAEGAAIVRDVAAAAVDPANEGSLVHLTALATTDQVLTDPDFGISAPAALRLVRNAETYQWREDSKSEKRKKLGGSEETRTTYTYRKDWSRTHQDSSRFHSPSGHENPASLEWESRTMTADRVTCGAFTLGRDLVSKIEGKESLPADASDEPALRAPGFRVAGNMYYKGRDPEDPQVGDVRVRFEVVRPHTVSVVAMQRGSGLAPYSAKAGSDILLLEDGEVGAAEMFQSARTANTIRTWLIRLGGFMAMFVGLLLILRPLSVLGSVVPAIGTVLGTGLGVLSFLVAAVLSLATVALAWLASRPLVGGFLLLLAAGGVILLLRARRPATVVPPPLPQV